VNLSEGGLAVDIGNDKHYTTYGEDVIVGLKFPLDTKVRKVPGQIVGSVHHQRSLRFVSVGDDLRVLLNMALEPGFRGIATRLASVEYLPQSAEGFEQWNSPFGGTIKIFGNPMKQGDLLLEYRAPEYSVDVYCHVYPEKRITQNGVVYIGPIEIESYDALYLHLSNIINPSPRLFRLIQYLSSYRAVVVRGQGKVE
jgi:hypothetical protein